MRGLRVLAIPLANPDKTELVFPPAGIAYRENGESHYLWRWIGITAPDLVVISGVDDFGLGRALGTNAVAGVGRIPVRRSHAEGGRENSALGGAPGDRPPAGPIAARRWRSNWRRSTGTNFPKPSTFPGMALIGRLRLGERADVERIVAPFV